MGRGLGPGEREEFCGQKSKFNTFDRESLAHMQVRARACVQGPKNGHEGSPSQVHQPPTGRAQGSHPGSCKTPGFCLADHFGATTGHTGHGCHGCHGRPGGEDTEPCRRNLVFPLQKDRQDRQPGSSEGLLAVSRLSVARGMSSTAEDGRGKWEVGTWGRATGKMRLLSGRLEAWLCEQ